MDKHLFVPWRGPLRSGFWRGDFILAVAVVLLPIWATAADPEFAEASLPQRSPRNQVYQWMANGSGTIAGYLWVPETCRKIRGLLIFAQNVPEGFIAGHPAFRAVCSDNNLGIVFTSAGFWQGKVPELGNFSLIQPERTKRLQLLLNELAEKSGYSEVATVPWLPLGESMSELMVTGLLNEQPERCIAGVYVCDIYWNDARKVPILATQGTGMEWGQTNRDIRTAWRNPGLYQRICDLRKESPAWPVTLMVEAGGGHFDCSERMLQYIAGYIDRVVKARLGADGSPALKPIDIANGWLADLPIPGKENPPVESARGATNLARPWFFDRASAEQAQAIARVNWEAPTQLPLLVPGGHCTVTPWAANSVTTVQVTTADDFSLRPILFDNIPAGFVGAGEPLAQSAKLPLIHWVSGVVAPLEDNRFGVELDRNYKTATGSANACLEVVAEPSGNIRKSVQPLLVSLSQNLKGSPQTINFKKIDDVTAGTLSLPLQAVSSAGLPVKFYVEAGPAMIKNNRLVFTRIPPRAKFPIAVTVVAWQWGTCEPPLFRQAITNQIFHLLK